MMVRVSADEVAREPNTEALLGSARSGDATSFQALYERVAPALVGWAALRLRPGIRGRVEPDEIAQETWVRALSSWHTFDPAQAGFRRWIFGVAKNVLADALATTLRSRELAVGSTSRAFALENLPDGVTSATRRLASDDALSGFLARVQAHGDDERTLVLLCGLEGQSLGEAALRLGISDEAAKKRWQRLRADLIALDVAKLLFVEE